MPRRKQANIKVREVDVPRPARSGQPWLDLLMIAFNAPGRWFRINILDTPKQAADAQSNLTRRYVTIPDPNGDWQFASRGCEVFAKYMAKPKRRKRGSVRRVK